MQALREFAKLLRCGGRTIHLWDRPESNKADSVTQWCYPANEYRLVPIPIRNGLTNGPLGGPPQAV
jgi:hypothetical protein